MRGPGYQTEGDLGRRDVTELWLGRTLRTNEIWKREERGSKRTIVCVGGSQSRERAEEGEGAGPAGDGCGDRGRERQGQGREKGGRDRGWLRKGDGEREREARFRVKHREGAEGTRPLLS